MGYNAPMTDTQLTVEKTEEFDGWLRGLRDARVKAKVFKRISQMELGSLGNVKPVGEGVSESKIDYGPGYRLYFKRTGKTVILLLVGGDKATQAADIKKAKEMASKL